MARSSQHANGMQQTPAVRRRATMPLPSAASRQASQPALAPLSKLALGGGGSSGGAGGGSASVEEVNELVQRLVVMDSMNLQLQV